MVSHVRVRQAGRAAGEKMLLARELSGLREQPEATAMLPASALCERRECSSQRLRSEP